MYIYIYRYIIYIYISTIKQNHRFSLFLILPNSSYFSQFLGFFVRSYSELTPWQHFLGLSGGFAHGLGCLLSIQAGRVLGNAIAMSITRCQPLVCATWGVLVWDELHGARWKTKVIFGAMLLMFVLALILFLLAGS